MCNILIKKLAILTEIFIIYLLKILKYKTTPIIIPNIMYERISPFVKLIIEIISTIPDKIQNKASCKYVIKSNVLITFLCILKKSNKSPIIIPVIAKIISIFIWSYNEVIKFF